MLLRFFRSTFLLLVLPIQLPSAVFAQRATTSVPPSETLEIPFEYTDGYLMAVRGSVGARTNLQFLIDFGTTYTILDRHLLSEPDQVSQGLDVAHFATSIQTKDVAIPELAV